MLSIVVYGRNDSHGYNLHKRVALSLNCMAALLDSSDDEILFVDYNTPDNLPTFLEAIQDTLTPTAKERLRLIRVRSTVHDRLRGHTHLMAVESFARNIGARRSNPANRWLLSTNTDMIFVPHDGGASLSSIVAGLPDGYYGLPRFELPESLWESLDRLDPETAIASTRRWGTRFHINDVVHGDEDILYDAPGDFQLVLRQDFFGIGGFDERMILGWHVDSNLSRRMRLLRGRLDTAAEYLFGYHCDHTRQATLMHGHDRVEDDWEEFVSGVTDPAVPGQMESWGLAGEELEEYTLATTRSRACITALERLLEPRGETVIESHHNDRGFHDLSYSPEHVLPYLCDLLSSMPRHWNLVYVGCRRAMFDLVTATWRELGFTGSILLPEGFGYLAGEMDTGMPLAQAMERATLVLAEFGYGSGDEPETADGTPSRPGVWNRPDTDRLTRTKAAFEDAMAIEAGHTPAPGEPLRYFIAVNAIFNLFESAVEANLSITYTPYSSRLRHGYLLRPRLPEPVGERRAMGRWLQNRLGRRAPVPFKEVRHLLRLARALQVTGTVPPDLAPSAVRFLARPLLALLEMPGFAGFAGASPEQMDALRARIMSALPMWPDDALPLLPVGMPPAGVLNRVACVEDWEDPAWLVWGQRHFGGHNAYNYLDRGAWSWERIHLLNGLSRLGVLTRGRRVLVVAWKPDAFYAVLTQHVGRVDVVNPAPIPSDPVEAALWERPIELVAGGRLYIHHGGLPAVLAAAPYDAVVFVGNALFGRGPAAVAPLLAWADTHLAEGGVLAWPVSVLLNGDHPGPWLDGATAASGSFLRLLETETGLEATDTFAGVVSEATLDRVTDIHGQDLHHGFFIADDYGARIIPALNFHRKRMTTTAHGWAAVAALCGSRLYGPVLSLMRGTPVVSADTPAGLMLYGPYLRLGEGHYTLTLEGSVDGAVSPERAVLNVAVQGSGDAISQVWRDVTAGELAAGPVSVAFTVPPGRAVLGPDGVPLEFRTIHYGGVAVTVTGLRLNPVVSGSEEKLAEPAVSLHPLSRMVATDLARERESGGRAAGGVSVAAGTPPGDLLYGPYLPLPAGDYRLNVRAAVPADTPAGRVALAVMVMSEGIAPLRWHDLRAGELAGGTAAVTFTIPPEQSVGGAALPFQFRLSHLGGLDVEVTDLELTRLGPPGEDCVPETPVSLDALARMVPAGIDAADDGDGTGGAELLLYGPYLRLPAGDYRLRLAAVAQDCDSPHRAVLLLQISRGGVVERWRDIVAGELAQGPLSLDLSIAAGSVVLHEGQPLSEPLEFRLSRYGGSTVTVTALELEMLPAGTAVAEPAVQLAPLSRMPAAGGVPRRGLAVDTAGLAAGLVLFGPYVCLPAGGYDLSVTATVPDETPEQPLLTLEVAAKDHPPLFVADLRMRDLVMGGAGTAEFRVPFTVPPELGGSGAGNGVPFEFRLGHPGAAGVTIDAVAVVSRGTAAPGPAVRDLALLPRLHTPGGQRFRGRSLSVAAGEPAGTVLFGTLFDLPPGTYRLSVTGTVLTATGDAAPPDQPVLALDIALGDEPPLQRIDLSAEALSAGAVIPVSVPAGGSAGVPVNLRLAHLGGLAVTITDIGLVWVPDTPPVTGPVVDLSLLPRFSHGAVGRFDGRSLTLTRGDNEGLALFGPYLPLPAGAYRLMVRAEISGDDPDQPALSLDVSTAGQPPLLLLDLPAAVFADGVASVEFAVPPELAGSAPWEVRIGHLGRCDVRLEAVDLMLLPVEHPAAWPDPRVSLTLLSRMSKADGVGERAGNRVVVRSGEPAGTVLFGPYLTLPPGHYRLKMKATARALFKRGKPALDVAVVAGGESLRDAVTYPVRALSGVPVSIDFDVSAARPGPVECVLSHHGTAALDIAGLWLTRVGEAQPPLDGEAGAS